MPVDGHFDDRSAVIHERNQEIHIKGKARNGQPWLDRLKRRFGHELQTALTVINRNVQQLRDQRCEDTAEQVTLELALHLTPQHLHSGSKQRCWWCQRRHTRQLNQTRRFSGRTGAVGIDESQPIAVITCL